jgi:hypothetical protein
VFVFRKISELGSELANLTCRIVAGQLRLAERFPAVGAIGAAIGADRGGDDEGVQDQYSGTEHE